jgi:hypothetical protein
MDPTKSAGIFFKDMKAVTGWETLPVGKLCQTVQKAEAGDRYTQHEGMAKKVCAAAGL